MTITSELVNDDWERIYIDGELAIEGHMITARQLMMELSLRFDIAVNFTEIIEEE